MKKHLYKVLILGDAGAGKTSLMNAFVMNKFSHAYKATIGADFITKALNVGDDVVTLQIWDTSGQERFNSLGMPFYRGADCCIFVYDVTRATSLANIEMWYNQLGSCIDSINFDRMSMVLIACKTDLPRIIKKERAENLARRYGMSHYETSAKEMDNIRIPFEHVARKSLKKDKDMELSTELPSDVYLNPSPKSPPKQKCC
jgi:Ras-related protein Rab-7A